MKLLCVTEQYGGRIMVRPSGYGDTIAFAGPQPDVNTMLLLDMPGLGNMTIDSIVRWLTQREKKWIDNVPLVGALVSPRRQINELPPQVWRKAVLDDMLTAYNYNYISWRLNDHFSLAEFTTFADRWLPEMQQRLHALLALPPSAESAQALAEAAPWLERVALVITQTPRRAKADRDTMLYALENARIATLRRGPFSLDKWIATAEQIHTSGLLHNLLHEIADQLVQTGEVMAGLERIKASARLRHATEHAQTFWSRLERSIRLEPNVHGETIDISQATEQTVYLSWRVLEARRIGTMVAGRSALVFNDSKGRLTYVAGERKLKFRVTRVGGRLEKFGNTLTTSDAGASAMHQALLEVDLLDTLANLDPQRALERVGHLGLPPDHAVYQAAATAREDPRQSRILADLLIELSVGVDADIARRLARAQARANRR